MRVEKLVEVTLSSLLSLLAGFIAVGVLLGVLGYDSLRAYSLLAKGALENLDIAVNRAALLILTGLAFAIPALAGLFNIGGESMAYIGSLISLVVGYYIPHPLPALLIGGAAGALLGLVVAMLKYWRGVHEVVSTVMLNWILYYLSRYIVVVHLKDPIYPDVSKPLPAEARLESIAGLHAGLLIAIICAIAAYVVVYYTRLGLYMRAMGLSPEASRIQGVNPRLAVYASMALGGFFGGLAGAVLVVCETFRLDVALSSLYGVGFDGIGVALLAWNNPLAVIASAFLISSLLAGGYTLQIEMGLDIHLVVAIIGVIVFSLGLPSLYTLISTRLKTMKVISREL